MTNHKLYRRINNTWYEVSNMRVNPLSGKTATPRTWKKPIIVNDTEYESCTAAARSLGLSITTVWLRAKSVKYENYYFKIQ